MIKPIILIGFPTCGKTTLGELISNKTNLKFIDLDKEFKNKYLLSPQKYIKKYGFFKYRNFEYLLLKNTIESNKYDIIATGGGIVEHKYSREILKSLNSVVYLCKNRENLKKDIFARFPNLYFETFNTLFERRSKYFNECARYKYHVGELNVMETVDDLINKLGL